MYNVNIYSAERKLYCMNYENTEKNSVLPIAIMIIAGLSFILGVFSGITLSKLVLKCKKSKNSECYTDFDADEYVRSLNLDDDE